MAKGFNHTGILSWNPKAPNLIRMELSKVDEAKLNKDKLYDEKKMERKILLKLKKFDIRGGNLKSQ